MKSKELAIASATLILVTFTLALSIVGQALSPAQTSRTLSNAGAVRTIGVGVYWDNACTDVTSSIDWGTLEPGSNKNFTYYIRNEGNSPSTLSMYTSNWGPQNAPDYINLSWDYDGQSLNPNEVAQVTFTLSVSASIDGITNFRFDITIVGSD
ncbi:MAG: hypothetical protein JSV75_03510 [Candidatus Bathyarchaeota archaeon]|nr:MAG: hypothetical protein JSV75_03510 [Candidatus Bathyarchaeota archaeon]